MNTDTPYRPTLSDHIQMETEDARIEHAQQQLDVELETSGIRRVAGLLDGGGMMQRAITLTPDKLAHMDTAARRQLLRWIERRVRLLDEKASLLAHNMKVAPEEVPEFLRMAGASSAAHAKAECA